MMNKSKQIVPRLRNESLGYAFRFKLEGSHRRSAVTTAVVATLVTMRFDGRCEFYEGEHRGDYVVGIGLRYRGKHNGIVPDYMWWQAFLGVLERECRRAKGVALDEKCCEFARIRAMRTTLVKCGAVEFQNGNVTELLEEGEEPRFMRECGKRLNEIKE